MNGGLGGAALAGLIVGSAAGDGDGALETGDSTSRFRTEILGRYREESTCNREGGGELHLESRTIIVLNL